MDCAKYERRDAVGLITVDRPKALNALNSQVLDDLDSAFGAVDVNEVRCVVLTGAGEKAFVAGADIAEMSAMTRAEARAYCRKGNALFHKIETFPVPVIAAVNGYALGGGCELAMACDIRLISENALFGQPETGLGITPGFGGTFRLARLVGPAKAKELIFTGAKIKAQEALALGLANAVCPPEALLEKALEMARAIASNAPIAVRAAKKAIDGTLYLDTKSAVDVEEGEFGNCFETADQREAMTAFIEKRKPAAFKNC
ncbi:MAG: enoyl-CoA hydratase/isomerase family protein [Synergistaceae bacterium]|jgi:enoyl-CoA hydratase|nr:enoyl-CoA hydratase/isomerase family protein [Synergistaceae bacterium]